MDDWHSNSLAVNKIPPEDVTDHYMYTSITLSDQSFVLLYNNS